MNDTRSVLWDWKDSVTRLLLFPGPAELYPSLAPQPQRLVRKKLKATQFWLISLCRPLTPPVTNLFIIALAYWPKLHLNSFTMKDKCPRYCLSTCSSFRQYFKLFRIVNHIFIFLLSTVTFISSRVLFWVHSSVNMKGVCGNLNVVVKSEHPKIIPSFHDCNWIHIRLHTSNTRLLGRNRPTGLCVVASITFPFGSQLCPQGHHLAVNANPKPQFSAAKHWPQKTLIACCHTLVLTASQGLLWRCIATLRPWRP